MSRTLPRKLLTLTNSLLENAGVRILTMAEYRHLLDEPIKRHLTTQSGFIALAGTLTAFVRYLSLRSDVNSSEAAPSSTEEYLQHPETLACRVRSIAIAHDNPIDRFMAFYSDHYRECNSQWSQDIFVSYMLKQKKNGIFIELGGADGVTHSNSLSLETLYSWSGTLIEPHPSQYQLLRTTRSSKANRLLQCAISISNERGTVQLSDNGQLSSVQGFDSDDLHSSRRNRSSKQFTVNCIPFKDVFDAYDEVDYLSLDVEGPEIELLNQVDWSKSPAIITVEHNWRPAVIGGLRDLLKSRGYVEAFQGYDWLTRGDLWFFHPDRNVEDVNTGSTDASHRLL